MKSKLEKLKGLIKNFEATQEKHKEFGAGDTEPSGVFQGLLCRTMKSKEVVVPTSADDWQLYREPGCQTAARSLTSAAKKCLALLSKVTMSEATEVRRYLTGYCWRCDW